jgi:hypothetical protein
MFPSYNDLPSLTDRIRPDRRRVSSATEIRMRVKRVAKAA